MTDFLRQFRSRRLLCQTLADFSARQRQVIDAGDDDGLAELLLRKDRVLARLTAESNPKEWRSVRDFLDADTRDECERLLSECEEILATVQKTDLAAAARVTARRDETKRQLAALSEGQTATEGYDVSPTAGRVNFVT